MGARPYGVKRVTQRVSDIDAGTIGVADGDGRDVDDVGGESAIDDNATDRSDFESADRDGFVDPTAVGTSTGSGSGDDQPRKRRGRKPGSRNKSTGTGGRRTTSQATDSLTKILYSVHMMLGAALSAPELMMTEEESRDIADAATRVTELYEMPLLDEKTLAWANLGIVMGRVYGTRAVAIMARVKSERKNKTRSQVVTMQPASYASGD